MPTAKSKGRPKSDPNKPKLQYSEKDMKWVLKADWKDADGKTHAAGTPMSPQQPSWAIRSGGEIDFARFIRAWNSAFNLEDVHKKFFWRSPGQLSRQRSVISDWLEKQDIHPLKTLRSKRAKRKQWSNQLASLLDAGELTRKYTNQPRQRKGESDKDFGKRSAEAMAD